MVEEFDVIDQAGLTPDGQVGLMMYEHRDWINPSQQVQDLYKKTQVYPSYAVDGDMIRDNPRFASRPVWIRLVAKVLPPPQIYPYLPQLKSALAKHGIEFQLAHFDPNDANTGVNNLVRIPVDT